MCGIAGIFNSGTDESIIEMLHALSRRGPDGQGVWQDTHLNLKLGHTRLAIQDLSEAGKQPMLSRCGRFVVTLNGEIYNHKKIRRAYLSDIFNWRGTSDTETLVELVAKVGIDSALEKLVGMFAFAVFDIRKKTLTLVRDRLGEKPIYWSATQNSIVFTSDIGAMRSAPQGPMEISGRAMSHYFEYGYVPAPLSIYDNVSKLEPGSYVEFVLSQYGIESSKQRKYWDFQGLILGLQSGNPRTEFAQDEVERQLTATIKDQLIADVPVGVFLSGGIDSSVVAMLMAKVSSEKIKTFSIGFNVPSYDESEYARKVAEYIGSDHDELILSENDCIKALSTMPDIYSEPFADSSQIPSYLLSKLASESVTVALTGDGGDEVFGGYNRHIFLQRYQHILKHVPHVFGQAASLPIGRALIEGLAKVIEASSTLKSKPSVNQNLSNKMYKATQLFGKTTSDAYELLSRIAHPLDIVSEQVIRVSSDPEVSPLISRGHYAMARDTVSYLPDDVLVKVDRAAMYCSLETRAPFLDHRLIELVWSLPTNQKIRNGRGKLLLRRILEKNLPRELFARPKAGFAIPLASWLRGPLKELAGDLFFSAIVKDDPFIDHSKLSDLWDKHTGHQSDNSSLLWAVLMYSQWKIRQV